MKKHRALLIVLVVMATTGVETVAQPDATPQQIESIEFINQPVRDILAALGAATGNTVIPDETVTGSMSISFSDTDFLSALEQLALTRNLHVAESGSVFQVSAVSVSREGPDSYSVEATGVSAPALLRRISEVSGEPVVFGGVPPVEITYHTTGSPLQELLSHVTLNIPGYELSTESGAFVIRSSADSHRQPSGPDTRRVITRDGSLYSANVTEVDFLEILTTLFELAEEEFQYLKRNSARITRIAVSDKSFEELLTLLCEQADASYSAISGIYYVVDASPLEAVARTRRTEVVQPEHTPLEVLIDRIPPEHAAGVTITPDRRSNTMTVSGQSSGVTRVLDLIDAIDRPPTGRTYERFEIGSISIAVLPTLLPAALSMLPIFPSPDGRSFVSSVTPEQAEEMRSFLGLIDTPVEGRLVELSHISADALISNLPPGLPRSAITETVDPATIVFHGSAAEHERALEDLRAVDQSPPQIRYQLLVVQFEEGTSRDYSLSLGNSVADPDSFQAFLGNLGPIMALSFDVVSAFGYQFALELSTQIGESNAAIVADTTLNALSGHPVRFRSTSTYRYRDPVVPGDSDDATASLVREITSGLVLEVDGWANGSGEVTMNLSATLSRQGNNSKDDNLPRTHEKTVETQVRAASGSPVIVSGLVLGEDQEERSGPPLLSRIPLIGKVFQRLHASRENTELAIYIIPHVESGEPEPPDLEDRLRDLYDYLEPAIP